MTSFAPPAIYQCPGCRGFVLRRRMATINFSGTRDWSDGAPTAWWAQAPLVRCHSCAAIFWLADFEPIGELPRELRPMGRVARMLEHWRGDTKGRLRAELEWLDIPAGWKTARDLDAVDFDDVAHVLNRPSGLSREKLLWLRRRTWWSLNDRYRLPSNGSPIRNVPIMDEAKERANMQSILALLDQHDLEPRDMIEKGELLRLLGRFDDAVAVLKAVPPDGYNEIRASKIEWLARAGDIHVRPLSEEVR